MMKKILGFIFLVGFIRCGTPDTYIFNPYAAEKAAEIQSEIDGLRPAMTEANGAPLLSCDSEEQCGILATKYLGFETYKALHRLDANEVVKNQGIGHYYYVNATFHAMKGAKVVFIPGSEYGPFNPPKTEE